MFIKTCPPMENKGIWKSRGGTGDLLWCSRDAVNTPGQGGIGALKGSKKKREDVTVEARVLTLQC